MKIKNKNRYLKILVILTLIIVMLSFTGCKAPIDRYENEKIKVTGLGKTFYITPKELSKMEIFEVSAKGNSDKAGTVEAYGPTLKTFLKHKGYSLDDVYSAKIIASDKYAVTLGEVTWDKYDVILSIANGTDELLLNERPMRIVIPGASSGKWVRSVIEIKFELKK